MTKRLISLILSILLTLSLSACGSADNETLPPTTAPTVPSVSSALSSDPLEAFDSAADRVAVMESMLVDYSIDKEMVIGTDTYLESQTTTLSIQSDGSGMLACSSTDLTWGEEYYATTTDVYSAGTLYGTVDDFAYSTEMTSQEYLARFIPAVLVEPGLYESVVFVDDGTISFSSPSGPEAWLEESGLELKDAFATASISTDGMLTGCTYQALYEQSGVRTKLTVTTRIVDASADVKIPDDLSAYPQTDYPEAPLAFERALGMLLQARDVTSSSMENIVVEAGAVSMAQQSTMNCFGSNEELAARFDTDVVLTDLSTGVPAYEANQLETFREGVYAISTDGSAPEADPSVDTALMRGICQTFTAGPFPLLRETRDLKLEDAGSAYLLEYTLTPEAAKEMVSTVCATLFEEPELLDSLATDYRTEYATGFIGIDKLTGLPLSLGQEFKGIHTIDGTECALTQDLSLTISTGTGESYETLTGEALPVEPPASNATPLLYHVTGKNGEQMWLFGTIHVGDARTAYLPGELTDAFAASDALAVEFDTDAFMEQMDTDPELMALIAQSYLYTDGTTIADHLEDDTLIDQMILQLKISGSYNPAVLMMRPIILSQSIQNDYLRLSRSLTPGLGADAQLLAMAREQGKQILNVESGEAQLTMLAGFSDELQELLLRTALEQGSADYVAETLALYELWCTGDEDALRDLINSEEEGLTAGELQLYQEYTDALSTQRNESMLEVAKEYLSGGDTVFYAVGLAHLLAEDGLVNALRDAGYTVEAVIYE